MRKQIMAEKGAKPVGPYSHAIMCKGTLLFVAGQGPYDPETKKVPETFREAAAQTLTNIRTILEAAGATMADVVKVNVFLRNLDNFGEFNEVYRTFFPEPYPARSAMQSNLTTPLEVDAIAVMPE